MRTSQRDGRGMGAQAGNNNKQATRPPINQAQPPHDGVKHNAPSDAPMGWLSGMLPPDMGVRTLPMALRGDDTPMSLSEDDIVTGCAPQRWPSVCRCYLFAMRHAARNLRTQRVALHSTR